MLKRLIKAIDNPGLAFYHIRARLNREALFARYASLCRQAGINQLFFILSFDCDNVEDIGVAWEVHQKLQADGIAPVYAVPGEMLEQGEKVYRKIAETGAEFINHGYTDHAVFDPGVGGYVGCFFYDKLPPAVVEEDIRKGDEAIRNILGQKSLGFRAPHFPTFQKAAEIRFIHRIIGQMGYRFSSSTLPYHGFRYGAVNNHFGVIEIPLSGMWSHPLRMLDSWGCFRAPDRVVGQINYYHEGSMVLKHIRDHWGTGILNYYVDPSHIADNQEFYSLMSEMAKSAKATSYCGLLRQLHLL